MDQSVNNSITMFERFCDEVGIDSNNVEHIRTMLLVFQKNSSIQEAYARIFDRAPYIDWDRCNVIHSHKGFRDTAGWVTIAQFTVVNDDDVAWRGFLQRHKVFTHFMQCLSSAKLSVNDNKSHLIHLFLLLNIVNLQAINVIEMFFSMLYNKAVHSEALTFFSSLADSVFDKEDRTEAVVSLLRTFLKVDSHRFAAEVELQRTREGKLLQIFKQKQLQAVSLRPRLRSKLKRDALQNSALATLDSFRSWSDTIRFPNVFSLNNKKRLYFLMSQTRLDHLKFLHQFVHEPELAQTISQYQVKGPDVDVIVDTILQCRITQDPFPELHQFRERCFNCFSLQQKSKLRLNDLLHLYIAAYQPETSWKATWKAVLPVLSIQIIRDVEAFVEKNAINDHSVMRILFAD